MCEAFFDKATLKVDETMGLILFVCNIIIPGLGTSIMACTGPGGKRDDRVLCYGICEFFGTFIFFIGWCVSIYHGFLILRRSRGEF